MLSFFRHRAQSEDATGQDGHMLLITYLPAGEDAHHCESRISSQMYEDFLSSAEQELSGGAVEASLLEAYLTEIAANGPPAPITMNADAVSVSAQPFAASWGNFSLTQDDDGLALEFDLPGDGRRCRFALKPDGGVLDHSELGGSGNGAQNTLATRCCPRMTLSGTIGGEQISGQAWFDQHWGGQGWLAAPVADGKAPRLCGWDWFAINLDCDLDVIVMVRRDLESGDVLSQFAVAFQDGHEPRILDAITTEPLSTWESPKTMAQYPVSWAVRLPEIAAELRINARCNDQEIPVFGVMHAIWAGTASVSGHVDGAAIKGRARVELQGYASISTLDLTIDRFAARIDARIAAFFPRCFTAGSAKSIIGPLRWSCDPETINDMIAGPVWDLLDRGGKHWRPIFGLLLLEALGMPIEPYETFLSVVPEFLHTGSLIVDDIQDQSDTRRGAPAIHKRYGVDTAINAGNTLYFLPLLALVDHPDLNAEQRDKIFSILTHVFVNAHFGQAQDLVWSHRTPEEIEAALRDEATGDVILQGYAHKTAAAVTGIAQIVCVIAERSDAVRKVCASFGEVFGVAFQIVDDVNNFSRDPAWGKPLGEDLTAGKPTYVIYRAAALLKGKDRDHLVALICSDEMRSDPVEVQKGIAVVEKSGVLEECRKEAQEMLAGEWEKLAGLLPPSIAKITLRALCSNMIDHLQQT